MISKNSFQTATLDEYRELLKQKQPQIEANLRKVEDDPKWKNYVPLKKEEEREQTATTEKSNSKKKKQNKKNVVAQYGIQSMVPTSTASKDKKVQGKEEEEPEGEKRDLSYLLNAQLAGKKPVCAPQVKWGTELDKYVTAGNIQEVRKALEGSKILNFRKVSR
jgi:hypothetical protein